MHQRPIHLVAVVGTTSTQSATRRLVQHVVDQCRGDHTTVDLIDLAVEPLPIFQPDRSPMLPEYPVWKQRVDRADVYLLGTPDYHGSMSGVLKNFLDHFWREFSGKLFAHIVASNEKGLTVIDQMRTVARQCYAWSMPYAVSVHEREDLKEGQIINPALVQRLEFLARDVQVYGRLIAEQRDRDLAGTDPSFLARLRPAR
jgi:azobenzene reductase